MRLFFTLVSEIVVKKYIYSKTAKLITDNFRHKLKLKIISSTIAFTQKVDCVFFSTKGHKCY